MSLICKLFGHMQSEPTVLSIKTVNNVKTLKLATACPRCNTLEFRFLSVDAFDLENMKTRNHLIVSDQLLKSAHAISQRAGKQTAWQKFEDKLADAILDNTSVLNQMPEEIFKAKEPFFTRTTRSKD